MDKNTLLNEEELLKVTGGTVNSERAEIAKYCEQYKGEDMKDECNADPKCKYNKYAKNKNLRGCQPK